MERFVSIFTLRVTLFALLIASPAAGQPINGGFETGNFTGWQTIGDARIVNSSYGTAPHNGNYAALLTTGPGSVPIADVMNFLGIDPTTWSVLLPGVHPDSVGSAIKTSSPYLLGDVTSAVLSLSNGGNLPSRYGWALSINVAGRWSASGTGEDSSAMAPSSTPFRFESDQWGFPGQGDTRGNVPYTIAFFVVQNGSDFASNGYGLLVDDVTIVPEPTPTFFSVCALILVFGMKAVRERH